MSSSIQNKRGPGRPKNVERIGKRKAQILKAASNLFAERGYQSTDVQEIADQIGVAKGTIYHYFPSKEKLFLASVDQGMEEMSEFIDKMVEKIEDPIKKIARAIQAYLIYFDKNPQLIELMVQERAEFKDRNKPTYVLHREKNIQPWNEMFETLSKSGRLLKLEAEETTLTISSMLYGTIFTTYYAHQGITFQSRSREVLRMVFQGILSDSERNRIDDLLAETLI